MSPPAPAAPPRAPGRFRRALVAVGSAAGITFVFTGALVLSLVVHLDLGPTRRVARAIANAALGSLFKGTLVVGEIDRLSLRGLAIRDVTAYDPYGNEVARLEGLRADADVIGIARSAARGAPVVEVPLIHVDAAFVGLDRGPSGVPGIAETFLLRKPGPPARPDAVAPIVTLDRIEIDDLVVQGALAPPRSIDARVSRVGGSVRVLPDGVFVDVPHLAVVEAGLLPAMLAGDLGYHLHVPPAQGPKAGAGMRMEVGFEGMFGEIPISVQASAEGTPLDKAEVHARVDAFWATPDAIAAFLPTPNAELPLRVPVSSAIEASGKLPDLDVSVVDGFEGGGDVAARGKLHLGPPFVLDLGFQIDGVDPRVALAVPSATPLDASGRVRIELGADVAIDAEVATSPLSIAGNVVPAVKARAKLERGVLHGDANVDEVGAPTTATFAVDRAGGVRFEVESRAASLHAVPRLRGAPIDGAARVKVAGSYKDGAIDARATARVEGLRGPSGVALADGTVEGRVSGPLSAPTIDASLSGSRLRADRYAFDKVAARASGTLGKMRVETQLDGQNESVAATATLDLPAKALRNIDLHTRSGPSVVEGKVARVGVGPRGLEVDGVAIHGDGVGDLEGSVAVRDKELVGSLHGRNVDLSRVAEMAHLPLKVNGLANVDVDVRSPRHGERTGRVALEMVGGELPGLRGLSGSVAASFEGDRVRVDGLMRLVAKAGSEERKEDRCDGAIASVRVSGGEGVLGGPLLDGNTWRRASGRVELAAEDLNLRCIARLLPLDFLVSDVRGKVTARGVFERAPGARLPSVKSALVRTRGLEVAGLEGPDDRPEWESRSVDLEIRGSFDEPTGVVSARVALDDGVPIVSVGGRATVDMKTLLDQPERRAELLRKTPLELRVTVPRREMAAFATLPSFVRDRLPPLAGEVQINGRLTGNITDPRVKVELRTWGLRHALALVAPTETVHAKARASAEIVNRLAAESPWGLPLDVEAAVDYDGKEATATARVEHDGAEIASADARLAAPLADLLGGAPFKPRGSVHAKLDGVPLGQVPFLADREIQGHLRGGLSIEGLGESPRLKLDLGIPDLKIGNDLVYDKAAVDVEFAPARGQSGPSARNTAALRVALESKKGGSFLATAQNDVVWRAAFVPEVDQARPADVMVKADRFRIAALAPFVAGFLSRLDGTLDGEARLSWARLDEPDKAKAAVRMKLTGGLFHVPQLGQELHGAEIDISGGAGGLVKLDTIRAEGQKGRIRGSGRVRLDGLDFRYAEASFAIKQGEELPITLEGVPLGEARGQVSITAAKRGGSLNVTVGIPKLHIELPNNTARGVQSLDPNPDVVIAQDAARPRPSAPKSGSRLSLTFNLGDITVKGAMLDIGLSGVKSAPLRVEVADKSRITGDIQLTRGSVEVLHKKFEVEQGVVHMRPEDPGNPYVNVTARWDSPEGPIFIDYNGVLLPILSEKIKYRSPNIPEDRIMATLLFGGVEQSTLGATGTSGAGSVPGQNLAAQLIAQQLSTQITGNISTSVATNDDGTFRPGLRYRSGNAVIELSTYGASGQSAGGAAKGQHTLVTIDWQFWRNWMLRGRVDVAPDLTTSGVDVLWQYRY